MMEQQQIDDQLDLLEVHIKRHSLGVAIDRLREREPDHADEILDHFRAQTGELEPESAALRSRGLGDCCRVLPLQESPRWAFAKGRLGLPQDVVPRVEKAADEILQLVAHPRSDDITTRGLVLGHVQSGKTTSFLSVAAKALDCGYDLVIILAGIHNSLRRQTQNRAERTLVHKPDLWWLGTKRTDFKPQDNPLSAYLSGGGKRGLMVVKKHAGILRDLADWLGETNEARLRDLSVLVIDDEADQAGLDVSDGLSLAGIHEQLDRIVNLQTSDGKRRCAYLAYTATPFANILTSQREEGLYPRDFIYPLEKPEGHVGSAELFGDDVVGDPIQLDPGADGDELLTDGLKQAIRWFVLATAARVGLGEPLDSFHSSMLVHVSQLTAEQGLYRPAIEGFLRSVREEFDEDDGLMRRCYEETLLQVPARPEGGDGYIAERVASWSEAAPHVPVVLERLLGRTPSGEPFKEDGRLQRAHSGVIVDNGATDSLERLTYSSLADGEPSVTVIAIGGNTLSRGLTLEGLVASYFVRTARNYDSLMQMGRWYGFRPGYQHLVRVWTTQTLLDWFLELDFVERELRDELIWMRDHGLQPGDYGPRIRLSPNMNVTRASVIKSADTDVDFSDHVVDLAWLDLDREVIESNQATARELARQLGRPDELGGSKLFRDVSASLVETFLRSFRLHAEEKRLQMAPLFRHLEAHRAELTRWNVIFKSTAGGSRETFDYGSSVGEVNTAVRSRVKGASVALIQSLVDSDDHRLDFSGAPPRDGSMRRGQDEPPLLVVYAIDRVSATTSTHRVPLDAPDRPISFSIAMPKSLDARRYVRPVVAEVAAPAPAEESADEPE